MSWGLYLSRREEVKVEEEQKQKRQLSKSEGWEAFVFVFFFFHSFVSFPLPFHQPPAASPNDGLLSGRGREGRAPLVRTARTLSHSQDDDDDDEEE